ncbi:amino acid transporter AVT3B-like [Anneissia japonica]|uniref:amino acid transporter AVT3B-like n=1 Tax=Anneissia japonica TaxID=1529436 RepID=UPI0014256898|nr:amino acid transporter AVT3B-like [Anneissia japonica]
MVSCGRNFIDFANVFKAFVGSFYLSVAYWFSQCGLILTMVCILVTAITTDYCTQLMIKCKHEIINRLTIIDKKEQDITPEEKAHQLQERERIGRNLTYAEIANITLGKNAVYVVNTAIFITQFGFTTQYIIFLGNTIQALFPYTANNSTNNSNLADGDIYPVNDNARLTTAPVYELTVIIPIPFFIACSLFRDVRKLAPVSLAGNMAIFCGFFATLGVIYSDFHIIEEIQFAQWAALPLCFGAVSGAFEGIGTVIPVESSMVGNRHMYPCFLHLTIALLALISSTLGASGYLRFGSNTQQIIIENLIETEESTLLTIIYSFICLSVALTYPLQLFPVLGVIENGLFLPGKILGPRKLKADDHDELDNGHNIQNPLIDENKELAIAIPKSVPAWQRNMLRISLICIQVGIAILLKNQYAYFGSIVGTIGACVLGYILPPLIHIKLWRHQVSWAFTALNIFIVCIFGIIGGIMSLSFGFKTIIERLIN